MLDHRDRCKICDFGLAHRFERDGQGKVIRRTLHEVRRSPPPQPHGPAPRSLGPVLSRRPPRPQICGSKSYAAPDVLVGHGYDGAATDVWSCGICLFGMLAGFFPLDGATTTDWRFVRVCQAVIQGHSLTHTVFGFYNRPCPLTHEAVNLIDGMLSLNPTKRFTVPDALGHPWIRAKPAPLPMDDQENVPFADGRLPSYRHVAFAPVGAETVGLGMQMSMEIEACGVAAVGSWREVNSYAAPVYRGNAAVAFGAPLCIDGPDSGEEAGPPLPLQRQRAFTGTFPAC